MVKYRDAQQRRSEENEFDWNAKQFRLALTVGRDRRHAEC
jgi:hypothetical protein